MSDPENEKLTPDRAVRLLRAKAGELEARVHAEVEAHGGMRPVVELAADISLIAGLLADHMERTEASVEAVSTAMSLYVAHNQDITKKIQEDLDSLAAGISTALVMIVGEERR